jgi:hypothetical protein
MDRRIPGGFMTGMNSEQKKWREKTNENIGFEENFHADGTVQLKVIATRKAD